MTGTPSKSFGSRTWILWSGIGLLILFLTVWPLIYPEKFFLHISILLFLHLIGAVTLNLLMRAGLLSFAHPGFMGIGAYTSTLLMMKAKVPFFIAFPCSGIFPALLALAFGPIILRLKGVYFVLTSFLLGEVIRLIFVNWQSLCGGSGGIFDIPAASIGPISLAGRIPTYYFALAITLLIITVCMSLIKSEFGRALSTIAEDDTLAECTGVNTLKYKVQAFCIGAFMVGLAGSIFAHYIRYISPLDFTWRLGLDFIAYNVVGGITQLLGPTLGTVILMPLPEVLRGAAEYQWIMYSLVIILMLRFMPEGLASIRLRRLKTRAATAETPR